MAYVLAGPLLLLAALGLVPVRPEPACAVELVPLGAGPEWNAAVKALESILRASRPNDADCHMVVVDARTGQVTVTTRDGRRATRVVPRPSDLEAVVGALVVTVPHPPQPPPPPPPAPLEAAAAPPPAAPGFLALAVMAGGDAAPPGLSPELCASISLIDDRLEAGLSAAWVLGYRGTDGRNLGRGLSAIKSGVSLGARWTGSGAETAAGGRLSVTVFRWDAVEQMAMDQQGMMFAASAGSKADVRVGFFIASAWPARARFRLRAELGAEASVKRLAGSTALSVHVPSLPWWGGALVLGVESRLP
jgi:hypothetical protein